MKIFKKLIPLALLIVMICAMPTPVEAQDTDANFTFAGDMDCDLRFKAADLVLMQKAVLGVPFEYNKKSADMNGDGKITIKDLITLKKELCKPEEDNGYHPGAW